MAFIVTTAVRKMLAMKARKKVIQGSTSSGKTYGITPILYDRLLMFHERKEKCRITVTAESLPVLKDGAIQIFQDFLMDENRWDDTRWNGTDFTYRISRQVFIQFKTYDSVGKAKGGGKREILFINEANHVNYEIADALMSRTTKEVWLDFNADEEFWAHTQVLTSPNSEFLKLTYTDNEGLPKETLEDLMDKKRRAELEEKAGVKGYFWNWWQVYGLGEIGQRQELVYPPWDILKEKPARFQDFIYGLDFGFQHPTALIKIWYFEDEVYLEEVVYAPLLTSEKLVDKMHAENVDKEIPIIADHARPEMIQELRNHGFYVLNADKSVEKGLKEVRKRKVYVYEGAVNIIRENKKYAYKKINGILTDQIKKVNDDAMDAIRYGVVYIENYSIEGVAETITVNI